VTWRIRRQWSVWERFRWEFWYYFEFPINDEGIECLGEIKRE